MKSNQTTHHVVNWLELGVSKLQVPSKWLHSKATRKDPSALIKYSVDVPWDLHDTRVAPLVEQRCKLDLSLLAQVFNCTYRSCNLWEILVVISLMHALSTLHFHIFWAWALGSSGQRDSTGLPGCCPDSTCGCRSHVLLSGSNYCCKISTLDFFVSHYESSEKGILFSPND